MKFNVNKFRLFVKTAVTSWVPVALVLGVVSWSPEVATLIMGASVISIDGAFAIFGVEDSVPVVDSKR